MPAHPDRKQEMDYLSDANLRAVLTVLVARAGGSVEITNEELYDAMLPDGGGSERFRLTQTGGGIRVTVPAPPRTGRPVPPPPA